MNPVPTGMLFGSPHDLDLVIERTFRADQDDVWASLTTSESTARWIGPWEGEPGPGKTVRLQMSFEDGAPSSDLFIEACDPPRRLVLSFKDSNGDWHFEMSLRQEGPDTVLTFKQSRLDPEMVGEVGPGWEYYLDRLCAARSGEPMRSFDDYYPTQKPYYIEALKKLQG